MARSTAILARVPRPTRRDLTRFFGKVKVSTRGCWEWTGYLVGHGSYPRLTVRHVQVLGHRVAYHWFVGPFDPSLEIDHLCLNKQCVNPAHLEPVTTLVNIHRSMPFRSSPKGRVLRLSAEQRATRAARMSMLRQAAIRQGRRGLVREVAS